MERKVVFFALPVIALLLLIPLACSDNGPAEDTGSIRTTDQPLPKVSQKAEKDQAEAISGSIKGGKQVKEDKFTLVIPGDWKKHRQFDVWCPATENNSIRLPDHYLSLGARNPMMLENSDLTAGIKTHIGVDPQDVKPVRIGGMNGATCSWEKGGYQSIGLFLQERIPGFDIPMLNFFILRAPKNTFPKYEKTYTTILKSIRI